MPVKPIPDGFHTVTPYLVVHGVDRLIGFLEKALDAKDAQRNVGPDGRVMHAQIRIGDSMVMLGEARPEQAPMPVCLYLYVLDTDALYRRAMAAGAVSIMEPADQFYGDRNAGVKDPCGNQWWIATHREDLSPAEMARRTAVHRK